MLTTDIRAAARRVASRAPVLTKVAKRVAIGSAPIWDPVYVAWAKRSTGHRGPVPPFANRRRVGAWHVPQFISGGQQAHDDLADRFVRYTGRPLRELVVLDLASGAGRIARHFDGEIDQFTVCDVDPTAIAWMRRHFPRFRAVVNSSRLPLPFDDGSFDVVLSWSLWTHLPAEAQQDYLRELARILRPGGWAFLTVNGHPWLDEYQAYPRALPYWRGITHDQLRDAGVLYQEYEFLQHDPTRALEGVTGTFGLTFNDPAWVRAHWNDPFEVVDIEEGTMQNRQDLVVLRLPD